MHNHKYNDASEFSLLRRSPFTLFKMTDVAKLGLPVGCWYIPAGTDNKMIHNKCTK